MSVEPVLAIGGVICYVLASVVSVVSLVKVDSRRNQTGAACLALGSTLLFLVIVIRVVNAGCMPSFNLFDCLAWYVLALSAVYLLANTRRSMRGVAGILFPFMAFILLCGIMAQGVNPGMPPAPQGPWLVLHVIAGYTAYAVFSLASLNAAAYLIQDYNMKKRHFGPVWETLPSLEILDRVMSLLVGIAFLLLTISVILGCVLVYRTGGGERWIADPKVAAVAAVWILFAVLVHMRASADRHGRGVALLTVAGLVVVLFAFVGVHYIAPSLHAFIKVREGGGGL